MDLQFRNQLTEAPRLHSKLLEFLSAHPVSDRSRLALELATEEHFANIVNHGYRDQLEHLIHIRLIWVRDGIQIEFQDDGIPYDPLKESAPDLTVPMDARPVGGLGVHMIRSSMELPSSWRDEHTDPVEVSTLVAPCATKGNSGRPELRTTSMILGRGRERRPSGLFHPFWTSAHCNSLTASFV
jgi:serine/threonine-protein kinase RsbW